MENAIAYPVFRGERVGRYLVIACISAIPLAIVAAVAAEQWVYIAAALLILSLKKQYKLALLLIVTIMLAVPVINETAVWFPRTQDATLWRLDAALGFNPRIAILTLEATPGLRAIAKVFYLGFPIAISLACLASENAERFAARLAVATGLAFLIYLFVPACGPIYLLTSTAHAPRNAMPSMHTTWALMIWLEIRGKILPLRLAADLFLIFTIIATLGSGEHYLVDLLAAVPFWLAIEWLMK